MFITKYQIDGNGTCFLVILCITWLNTVNTLNDKPLLLLISMDGFRYDLLNATIVPNIWKFATDGLLLIFHFPFTIFLHSIYYYNCYHLFVKHSN